MSKSKGPGSLTIKKLQEKKQEEQKQEQKQLQEKKQEEEKQEKKQLQNEEGYSRWRILKNFQDKKEAKKQKFIIRTQAEIKRLNEVGLELSNVFFLDDLIKASDKKKAGIEGRHVHGYMEIQYEDYNWLIDNDVLDRACYLAYKSFKKIHYSTIDTYPLPTMYRTLASWPKKIHYDHFPEFEFNRMVLLSLEPINEAITFIDNYEPYQLDGYDTAVRLGPANLLNAGFPIYDLPVSVVKDTPGKDKFFFEAKTSSEELTKERDELLKKEIFEIRQKEKTNDEVKEELEIESSTARKMYSDLKHKMLSRSPFTDEYEFEEFEKRYVRKQHQSVIDWKKVLIGLGLLVLIVFLIIGCVFLFSPKPPTEVIKTAGLYTATKLSLMGV